ncbi:MAG: VWA domain-containing protein [Flavobacteriales bacterium]|jgi:Ca-activated chloride channel family protein|nr:VWA domain-containing protein [Flavobacteriales bacterium]
MLNFEEEKYFWLILAIIPLIILFIYFNWWRKKTISKIAEPRLWEKLNLGISNRKPWIHFILFSLVFIALTFSLVNLKIGSKLKKITREGVDIVFVMDVSKSMLAEDTKPSRIEKSKSLVSKFFDEFVSDRTGIVVYAGRSYPQLPLTTDYSAAKMFLKNVNTDIVPSYGTDVKSALEMAYGYFENAEDKKNRCIIMLSDGEDHENSSTSFAKKAQEKGIIIHTIGLGTVNGAPIPLRNNNGEVSSYKKDQDDEIVITKLNTNFLKDIADKTGGIYQDGNQTKQTIEQIKEALLVMEKGEAEIEMFEDYEDQFQWFIIFALIFLFLQMFIGNGKTQWIRNLKI